MSGPPLWPLSPNWREAVEVTYDFATDIFRSRSGKEQRRAQRTTPRKVIKFTVTRTAEDARTFSRFLTKYQGLTVQMADYSRFVRVAAASAPGGTSIAVEDLTSEGWLTGAEVVVLVYGGRSSALVVQSADSVSRIVTFTTSLGAIWPAGTKIYPSVRGRFDTSISVSNYGSRTIEAGLNFIVEPAQVRADDKGSPDDVFGLREIFIYAPNFAQQIQGNFARTVDTVDFGRGRTQTYLPISFSTRTKQYQLLQPDRLQRAAAVALFLRMRGQLGEFYMPSYEDDFTVVGAVGGDGSVTATFAGTGIHEVYNDDDVHRAIIITTSGGFEFHRRILTSSTDGTNTTLTTDFKWPCPIDSTVRINWLLVTRFAVDQLALTCTTDEVGQMQLSVTSLEDLSVSTTDDVFKGFVFDGAAQWVLDNWGMRFFDNYIADPLEIADDVFYPD